MVLVAQIIGKVMTVLSITLMIVLCIPIAYEAIARSFNAPTTWVFETTLYAFIFLGFLGNSLAVRSGAHFRVTLLMDIMPKYTNVFNWIAQIATMLFALLIMSAGVYFVNDMIQNEIVSATLLEIPLWIPATAIPLGGLGLFLQTFVQMVTGEAVTDPHMMGD
jgi:TRAP-type C4-dicarboxylate transport system permease small subunit